MTTYLNLIHETFCRALHPRGLLRLRKLLMSDEVVPALAPHVDVLAAITGTTLDLLHVIIGGRRVSSFAALPPTVVVGITGPWSRPGEPTGEEAPARGGIGTPLSSTDGGVGALHSSSTTLLGGRVLAASSFLLGTAGSSALSAAVVVAGCSTAATGSADLLNGSNRLCRPLASNVVRVDVRRRANSKTTFKQCQKQKQNA